jgi:hypothetical protein
MIFEHTEVERIARRVAESERGLDYDKCHPDVKFHYFTLVDFILNEVDPRAIKTMGAA